MGYRGSKSSLFKYNSQPVRKVKGVKEQRVDGSWDVIRINKTPIQLGQAGRLGTNNFKLLLSLRCTLMGFERSYQVKIPANQLMTRNFSLVSGLNPWFITGFSDAEGSFIVSVYRSESSKLKWRVTAYFSIHLHNKDIAILKSIKQTLGVGNVRKNSDTTSLFRVDNIQELQIIINHFDKYQLIGAKLSDYILFKQCFELIKGKEHLTQEGLEKIISLKYKLNKGLSEELIKAFPNIIPVDRPHYSFNGIQNPHWIAGFASGDSSFYVSTESIKSIKQNKTINTRVRLNFGTNLHIRDKQLLIAIANYLTILPKNINIYEGKNKQNALLQIRSFSQIISKIIPFFNEYPIIGIKSLDFFEFKVIAEMMKNKEHLTESGLNKIMNIVKNMNLRREDF